MICPACGFENIEGSDRCENCLAPFRDLDIPRPDAAEGLARSVMEDNLSRLDYDETICVAPNTPVSEVARRMKEAHSGCVLVLDCGRLVGIFTEHDVLLRMTGSDKPMSDTNADIQADEPAPAIPIEGIPIQDVPFNDIPLEEIRAEEMQFVEKDELEIAASQARPLFVSDLRVGELMSPNPETLHEHESVAFALNKMSMGRYRHLPVRKDDGTYSVASIRSVLKYIAQEDW
jgi:CBS domain-containing protein